jgi:hypothetical protein
MQLGHNDLDGRNAKFGMDIHRDAAAVVPDSDGVVHMYDDFHLVAEASHGFVDGVVHHFVDEMMQTAGIGTAYIHGRALADSGEAFEHGDRAGIILFRSGGPEILLAHGLSWNMLLLAEKAGLQITVHFTPNIKKNQFL